MESKNAIALFCFFSIAVSFVVHSRMGFAAAGRVDTASVPLPEDYPAKEKLAGILQRSDLKFIRGTFVNWQTILHYSANTDAVNRMMRDLVQCPDVKLNVRFRRLRKEGDWLLVHDSVKKTFEIQINLDSNNISLEELVIPTSFIARRN